MPKRLLMLGSPVLCVALLSALASGSTDGAPASLGPNSYNILDLNSIGPLQYTEAYGINNNGKMTGITIDPITSEIHAFVYQMGGAFQDLGMLGYPYGADGIAINNSGQIAATGYGPGYKALLVTNGVVKALGSIDGGSSQGYSINSLGHIVGRAVNGDGGGQGFSYINGVFKAMAVDRAACINDSDQIVGSIGYTWGSGEYLYVSEHAFLSSAGVITDLGNIGGGPKTNTEARSINNAGQITGYSTAANGTGHAFLYAGGVMQDLGTIAPYWSVGISINNAGTIVGILTNAYGAQFGSFVYQGGVMSNLLDLLDSSGEGWDALTAMQINDSGWILGTGTINGETHSFLARPNPITIQSVVPNHGPQSGVAGMIISGHGFTGASSVQIGGISASFTVDNDAQITANLPSSAKFGWADVVITSSAGTGTMTNGYDYFAPPVAYGQSAGAPALTWDASSWPSINRTVAFQLTPFAAGSSAWSWAGDSNSDWSGIPLPLDLASYGLPGDTIWASADYSIMSSSPSPSIAVAIPNVLSLVNRHFYFQSIVLDGATSSVVSTNAYDVVVGY